MTDKEAAPQALGSDGRWEVITQTSRYVLDLDSGTAQRTPGEGLSITPGDLGPDMANLRGDGLPVPLLEVIRAVVGDSMILLLQLRDDDVVTVRTTTLVRSMRALDSTALTFSQAAFELRALSRLGGPDQAVECVRTGRPATAARPAMSRFTAWGLSWGSR